MGTPDRDVLAADAVTLERQRVIQRALDEVYLTATLAAGRVVYVGAVVEVQNNSAWVMRYPAGATTQAHASVARRQLWPRTVPRMTVYYTSAVGSTATFNMIFNVYAFGPGVTTAAASVSSISWNPAGPAVANTILSTSATTSTPLVASPAGVVQLELRRRNGDANPNALDVLLAVVTFEESA